MSAHLITTTATVRTCPRCARPILAGIAEGLSARVDLTPVTDTFRDDRATYSLIAGQLHERDDFARAAGLPRWPVLAAHACPKETLW